MHTFWPIRYKNSSPLWYKRQWFALKWSASSSRGFFMRQPWVHHEDTLISVIYTEIVYLIPCKLIIITTDVLRQHYLTGLYLDILSHPNSTIKWLILWKLICSKWILTSSFQQRWKTPYCYMLFKTTNFIYFKQEIYMNNSLWFCPMIEDKPVPCTWDSFLLARAGQ